MTSPFATLIMLADGARSLLLVQMTDTLPIQMCFRLWALDLSLRGHEPINSDTKCFYYTTPLEPDTREQVRGNVTLPAL